MKNSMGRFKKGRGYRGKKRGKGGSYMKGGEKQAKESILFPPGVYILPNKELEGNI